MVLSSRRVLPSGHLFFSLLKGPCGGKAKNKRIPGPPPFLFQVTGLRVICLTPQRAGTEYILHLGSLLERLLGSMITPPPPAEKLAFVLDLVSQVGPDVFSPLVLALLLSLGCP